MKNGIPSDFPVDVDRFLMSETVGCMDNEQLGAYWRLLLYAWTQVDCTIPADDERLAKLSRMGKRWAKAGAIVRKCFVPVPGNPERLWNKLQVQTREEQKARMEKSAEKCEKMRQAKAAKQDGQLSFDDAVKRPVKDTGKRSYKEPDKEALEGRSEVPLVDSSQALSVPYSDSLPIPKGGGSPQTEDVPGPAVGVPPPPLAVGKAVSDGPFRPVPGHEPLFAEGGFPSSYKARITAARAVMQRIRADAGNYRIVLSPAALELIASNEKRQPPGWEKRNEEVRQRKDYQCRTLLPEAEAVLDQWTQRIKDLELASSGAAVGV